MKHQPLIFNQLTNFKVHFIDASFFGMKAFYKVTKV